MIEAIGTIISPFKEKFGIPRQPHLACKIKATIEVPFKLCPQEAFSQLEGFNFIWLISHFHLANSSNAKVRPPRLGGNKKIGVFATRSPFRPNPLGLSLVKLVRINFLADKKVTHLEIEGVDLVHGTPILDIKPYIESHDTPWEKATYGWPVDQDIQTLQVSWKPEVLEKIISPSDQSLIESILSLDPRPAFHQDQDDKIYHCLIKQYDIHFSIKNDQVLILDLNFVIG